MPTAFEYGFVHASRVDYLSAIPAARQKPEARAPTRASHLAARPGGSVHIDISGLRDRLRGGRRTPACAHAALARSRYCAIFRLRRRIPAEPRKRVAAAGGLL